MGKIFLFSLLFQTVFSHILIACPNCKDALSTEGARALAQGYYWSIMVMLSLPFLLTGVMAFLILRAYGKSKKSREEIGTQEILEEGKGL